MEVSLRWASRPPMHMSAFVAAAPSTPFWQPRPRLALWAVWPCVASRGLSGRHAQQKENRPDHVGNIEASENVSEVLRLAPGHSDVLLARIVQDYVRGGELAWADDLGRAWIQSTPESKAQEDTAALLVRAWLAVGGFTATSLEKAGYWLERIEATELLRCKQKMQTSKAMRWMRWTQRLLTTGSSKARSVSFVVRLCLKNAEQVNDADDLMSTMMSAGLRPPTMAFISLICAHASQGNMEAARKLAKQVLQSRPSNDGRLHQMLVQSFAEGQDASEAEGWLAMMHRERLAPTEASVVAVINSYARARRPFAAEATLKRFEQRNVQLGIGAYGAVIEAFLGAGKAEAAELWLQKASMISHGARGGDEVCGKLRRLEEQLRRRKSEADIDSGPVGPT
ncbi:unnamed protein product [Durusdinium trenchii]|uniref:Uncharacterized protein n=2 Tax=Durusdinium trenchii TaxID=1381693 RepID=A0ABP0T0J5_9DINO